MWLIVSPTERRNHPNLLGIRRWNRQLSRASKANPLDASPRPTDARFPAHTCARIAATRTEALGVTNSRAGLVAVPQRDIADDLSDRDHEEQLPDHGLEHS